MVESDSLGLPALKYRSGGVNDKPFGPQLVSFGPLGVGGTVVIAVGAGIPLTLHTGDD